MPLAYVAVVMTQEDGAYCATWFAGGHNSDGTEVRDCPDPATALKRLATQLKINDDRQAAINALELQGDDR